MVEINLDDENARQKYLEDLQATLKALGAEELPNIEGEINKAVGRCFLDLKRRYPFIKLKRFIEAAKTAERSAYAQELEETRQRNKA